MYQVTINHHLNSENTTSTSEWPKSRTHKEFNGFLDDPHFIVTGHRIQLLWVWFFWALSYTYQQHPSLLYPQFNELNYTKYAVLPDIRLCNLQWISLSSSPKMSSNEPQFNWEPWILCKWFWFKWIHDDNSSIHIIIFRTKLSGFLK